LPVSLDDRVLVDYRTSDDAGVYRLDEKRALVQTVDFFTPIVDDPFVYGQIAAANALSDVYAMGGRPLTALAIAGFPEELDRAVVREIFVGGLEKLREAGVALLGGHTVKDVEVKFGYAVTGEVDPARVLANGGAQPGDRILITKPIGTGVIATALKFNRAPAGAIAAAMQSMTTLNRSAAEVVGRHPGAVHACTDVTGFGVIGHASEMAASSGCSLHLEAARVPLLEGAKGLVRGNIPGGGRTNREHFGAGVSAAPDLDPDLLDLLFDPQTSGGLLLAVDPRIADALLADLVTAGLTAADIGCVVRQTDVAILAG
jgi:selenide,water dikinase